MAEAIFNQIVTENGLEEFIKTDSAGTGDWHIGEQPDPRALSTLATKGVPVDHRARQFMADDVNQFDYILAMDEKNFEDIVEIAGNTPDQLMMMRDFDEKGSGPVPDPYFGGEDGFYNVYDMLRRSGKSFLIFLSEKHRFHE